MQSFHYRGALRNNLPGGTIVLHPDEVHDGHAGNPEGFLYRMMYVEPALFTLALKFSSAKPIWITAGINTSEKYYRFATAC